MVEADLHSEYGIDIDDVDLMGTRSWRWLRTRIRALAYTPGTRLARSMNTKRR